MSEFRAAFEEGEEAAAEIVSAFSDLHPAVTMTWSEWQDLREIISTYWRGLPISDFATDPLYLKHRRLRSDSNP